MNFLKNKKIETKIQHKYLICDHPGLKNNLNKKNFFPKGQYIKNNTLSLPIHDKITKNNIKQKFKNIFTYLSCYYFNSI